MMINPALSKFTRLMILLSSLLATQTQAQDPRFFNKDPQFLEYFCNPNTNTSLSGIYSSGSPYQSNLNQILDSLVPFSSSNSFYSFTQGNGSDQIWTLFYCRYDFTSEECRACVESAANKALNLCRVEKEALVFYQQCTLHYANRNIFSLEEDLAVASQIGTNNFSTMDSNDFNTILYDNLDKLITRAAANNNSSDSLKFYGTLINNISSADTLYALVQCTPDIKPAECDRCLKGCVRNIPAKSKGKDFVRMFRASCQMTYGLNLFFRNISAAAPVPSPVPSDSVPESPKNGKSAMFFITRAVIPAVAGILILLAIWFCLLRRSLSRRKKVVKKGTQALIDVEAGVESTDCYQFDLKTIEDATNGFTPSNKLGEGGFGIVYQGVLENGQRVAVKRLSKNSVQGAQEFKTEVAVVAKLQHKNLVRLVGFCVEEEEQILVYEFMPNLSLERFLYDSTYSALLTWETRIKIIVGIARGLHYLHEDSRVKIVHRDLKISNILLDEDLDPKIADFGLARLVKVDQSTANTVRVVGTYGYMAPEYALAGRFSTKSDVYSYGVMILEILSGKSNNRFYESSHGEGLLRHAWRVWDEGAVKQLIDPNLQKNYSKIEAERCLQIGLLCVQDDESSRPTMHAVLMMLNNSSSELPTPFSPSLVSKSMLDSDASGSLNVQSTNLQSESGISSNTWFLQNNLHAR